MIFKVNKFSKIDSNLILSSLVSLFMKVLGALSGFLLTFFVTQSVSIGEAGVFLFLFGIVIATSTICRFGADNGLVRLVSLSSDKSSVEKLPRLVAYCLFIALFLSLASYLLLPLILDYFFPKVGTTSKIVISNMLLSLFPLAVSTPVGLFFQGLSQFKVSIFLINISTNLFFVIFIFTFGANSIDVLSHYYLISTALTSLLSVTILLFYFKRVHIISSAFTLHSSIGFNSYMKITRPLWIVSLMNVIIEWSGQILSGAFLSPNDVALLAVCQRLAMLTGFILMAVNVVITPRFARYHESMDIMSMIRLNRNSVFLMGVISAPLLLLLMLFPSFVLSFFGSGYDTQVNALRVLAFGQFLNVITANSNFILAMSGYEKDLRNAVVIAGIFCLTSSFYLIHENGIIGAAVSFVFGLLAKNLISCFYVKLRLGFNPLRLFNSVHG